MESYEEAMQTIAIIRDSLRQIDEAERVLWDFAMGKEVNAMAHRSRRGNARLVAMVEFPPRQPWWVRLFHAFHISARSW